MKGQTAKEIKTFNYNLLMMWQIWHNQASTQTKHNSCFYCNFFMVSAPILNLWHHFNKAMLHDLWIVPSLQWSAWEKLQLGWLVFFFFSWEWFKCKESPRRPRIILLVFIDLCGSFFCFYKSPQYFYDHHVQYLLLSRKAVHA